MPVTRKTTRTKKTEEDLSTEIELPKTVIEKPKIDAFATLSETINQTKLTYEALLKQIIETKQLWQKEQQEYERAINERNLQEDIARKREQETYEYETNLTRKKIEDDFRMKQAAWERNLSENKEKIEMEKKELEELRKRVATFEEEKEKAIKLACVDLQKTLQEKFEAEKKLREQENKSEKDLLILKLTNSTQDNSRLNQEIVTLKKMLDETTKEFRNVAVKVIESNKPTPPPPPPKPLETNQQK